MRGALCTVGAFAALVLLALAGDAALNSLWLWRRRRDRRKENP